MGSCPYLPCPDSELNSMKRRWRRRRWFERGDGGWCPAAAGGAWRGFVVGLIISDPVKPFHQQLLIIILELIGQKADINKLEPFLPG